MSSKKEPILKFEQLLNEEMKELIGTRNWNVWKNDIEPEMYGCILQAMYNYGKHIWSKAQKDAAAMARKKHKGSFPTCFTEFHP